VSRSASESDDQRGGLGAFPLKARDGELSRALGLKRAIEKKRLGAAPVRKAG
jgi:hypothetical protein